jgi:hypothetical protein
VPRKEAAAAYRPRVRVSVVRQLRSRGAGKKAGMRWGARNLRTLPQTALGVSTPDIQRLVKQLGRKPELAL